jgi:hypothetical protein
MTSPLIAWHTPLAKERVLEAEAVVPRAHMHVRGVVHPVWQTAQMEA